MPTILLIAIVFFIGIIRLYTLSHRYNRLPSYYEKIKFPLLYNPSLIAYKNECFDNWADEYDIISPGDLYECKKHVNKYGISHKNPYQQSIYKIVSKKEGWVEIKNPDVIGGVIYYVEFKKFLKMGYKCVYRNKQSND